MGKIPERTPFSMAVNAVVLLILFVWAVVLLTNK